MINPIRLGHVVLRVRDIKRSEAFYSRILGLKVTGRGGDSMVFFSSNEEVHHDLAIAKIADDAPGPEPNTVGLYHFAYELGSFEELQDAYQVVKESGVRIAGYGDHGDTKGLYIFDPDGNEIKLFAPAPEHEEHPLEQLLVSGQPATAG